MGAVRSVRPSARRRAVAVLAAGCALLTLAGVAPGAAQDLDDRRTHVDREIDQTEEHLDQSSARLAAADAKLQQAVVALDTARATLARTRGELAAAQAFDSRMQAELAVAVRDLARARAALAKSRARVDGQEDVLRKAAVHQYESGDPALLALSMVLNSQDTAQLTSQLNSARSVLDKEAVTLDRLKASRVMLAVQEAAFTEAKREVAERRAAAAENLERKQQLETEAEQAQAQIEGLVLVQSEARKAAARARTEDLRQLQDLESERQEISELLRRRAEQARREAAAAAQAQAAEAAARRAARLKARASQRAQAAPAPAPAPAPKAAPSPAWGGLSYPVDGYITSSYGMRFHPVYKRWSLHDGTDFGASCGTPVRAAAGGTVIAMYYNSGYGNRIIMDHGLHRGVGLGTSYNHLSGYSTYVGQRVERGEVIGYVGTTGYSTGCHLHFMVFENGNTVDPMRWL